MYFTGGGGVVEKIKMEYIAAIFMTIFGLCLAADSGTLDLKMPQVQPKNPDTYLCFSTKINDSALFITKFEPHAKMQTAHHMLLYGCETPGSDERVWDCGEMASHSPQYESGPTCANGGNIIYAWAMDAPSLELPEDVAFKVGEDSQINYLVLQVHYKDVSDFIPPKNQKDSSGITLTTTKTPLGKTAGVYLLGSGGSIPPKSVEFMEVVCKFDEKMTIHPMSFRTHAHTLGRVISGYRIRDGKWTEIGRKSPQLPQMFYNITNSGMDIKPGDLLAARCTFENTKNKEVKIGATQNDEMCNFYIMYYVDGKTLPKERYCFLEGPPDFYWEDYQGGDMHLDAMPETVSTTPGGKTWERTETEGQWSDSLEERDMEYLKYLLEMERRRSAEAPGEYDEPNY